LICTRAAAAQYSKAPSYWSNVRESLRQVGDLEIDDTGLATGGLLVRHLVMPEGVENAKGGLSFLAEDISRETFVNVMAQYRPHYKAKTEARYEDIGRGITPEEYRAVLDHARQVGLKRIEYDPAMADEGTGGLLGW
jgi:putative pyruvate formate lyase activating enzyme